ncbi:MAG: methionine adenosyltransferase [Candidatus Cloacimonadota bacterium]|nr:methionine adenosyltransferase [Candidatus Cloacimonadota bacterium]
MSKKDFLFTSESVTEGHPDKICDQISDAVLDDCLMQDSESRVAVECATKNGTVWVFGEITTEGYVDVNEIVRDTLKEIGYTKTKYGIEYKNCGILSSIIPQSPDISQGVTDKEGLFTEQGAGDQGIMFGFACNETAELMPLPITLAHQLSAKLAEVRKNNSIPYLGPDGKSQVTIEYKDNKPKRVHTIVISNQHDEGIAHQQITDDITKKVIKKVCTNLIDDETKIYINPTGSFIIGGPQGDAGLTGRKIIVDTYGGMGRHGGGAFSGKDPSKVDRSAAYAARYIAKNIVAAGVADKFEVQLSYAIGYSEPLNIWVNTFDTSDFEEDEIIEVIQKVFPLKPAEIIKALNLKRPIFKKTAAYGHFGRSDKDFYWERTDKVDEIKKLLGK